MSDCLVLCPSENAKSLRLNIHVHAQIVNVLTVHRGGFVRTLMIVNNATQRRTTPINHLVHTTDNVKT